MIVPNAQLNTRSKEEKMCNFWGSSIGYSYGDKGVFMRELAFFGETK